MGLSEKQKHNRSPALSHDSSKLKHENLPDDMPFLIYFMYMQLMPAWLTGREMKERVNALFSAILTEQNMPNNKLSEVVQLINDIRIYSLIVTSEEKFTELHSAHYWNPDLRKHAGVLNHASPSNPTFTPTSASQLQQKEKSSYSQSLKASIYLWV